MSTINAHLMKKKLSIMKGHVVLWNDKGQIAYDLKDAQLITSSQYKVVQDSDGACYLLRKSQNFDKIKQENPQQLAKLKKAYDAKKAEFLAIKESLKETQQFKLAPNHGQKADKEKRRTYINRTIRTFVNNEQINNDDSADQVDGQVTTTAAPSLKPGYGNHKKSTYSRIALTPIAKPQSKVIAQPSMKCATNHPVKQSVKRKANSNGVNMVYGQAFDYEGIKLAPFLGHIQSDLRVQGLLKHLEEWGMDAAKANVADVDLMYELRDGAAYDQQNPFINYPDPKSL